MAACPASVCRAASTPRRPACIASKSLPCWPGLRAAAGAKLSSTWAVVLKHSFQLQALPKPPAQPAALRCPARPPVLQVCETLDTAAGITANVMWQQAPAAAAAAAGSSGGGDDLLEPMEHRHAKDAGAAAKAGREEAADFARLYRHHQLAGGAAGAAATSASGSGDAAAAGQAGDAGVEEDQAAAAAAAELEAWQSLTPAEQLAALIDRLRGRYCYCLYCGCHYDSDADMREHCPGPSEADHE